jgi:hypothetical protein
MEAVLGKASRKTSLRTLRSVRGKPDGTWVLAPTEGPTADAITLDYELSAVGAEYAYLDDSHGSPVIAGTNGFFATYWDPGTM